MHPGVEYRNVRIGNDWQNLFQDVYSTELENSEEEMHRHNHAIHLTVLTEICLDLDDTAVDVCTVKIQCAHRL